MPQPSQYIFRDMMRCVPMWKLAFPGARLKVTSPIPYHLSPIIRPSHIRPIRPTRQHPRHSCESRNDAGENVLLRFRWALRRHQPFATRPLGPPLLPGRKIFRPYQRLVVALPHTSTWSTPATRAKDFSPLPAFSHSPSPHVHSVHCVHCITIRQLPSFVRRSLLKKPHKFFYSNIIQRLASTRVIPAFAGMTQARMFS
jgi:hypothetical protein